MIVQQDDAARRRRAGSRRDPAIPRERIRAAGSALFVCAAILLALLALAGCGKKGALYLPGEPPPPPSQSAPVG